jgi:hypothetical protein
MPLPAPVITDTVPSIERMIVDSTCGLAFALEAQAVDDPRVRAAVLTDNQTFDVSNLPDPAPGPGEL